MEDTAVPPEQLADYVSEFRQVLDGHGLAYGMFGHADVGCLHVRPILDMRDPADAALIRPISDAVAALTRKYGGLLWGEHGRGFRGEYSPLFFGPELYTELGRIKTVFDPANIFNPGKLAAPDAGHIDRIDEVPLRGERDRTISAEHAAAYDRAVACNGNGACHSQNELDPMCPSYKATGDRNQSPKGRAALLREWARLDSQSAGSPAQKKERAVFEDHVQKSLSTCLSCRACAGQCPVRVDIPTMRSRFLAHYYRTRRRPFRDRLVARLETLTAIGRKLPRVANLTMQNAVARKGFEHFCGLVDLPAFSVSHRPATARADSSKPATGRVNAGRDVILLEDTFTASFDRNAVEAFHSLLSSLGYVVHRTRPHANGKALSVLGFEDRFRPVAAAARDEVERLQKTGFSVVAIEAVTALMHEHEYTTALGYRSKRPVLTIDQFLAAEIQAGRIFPRAPSAGVAFRLFLHCTEKTSRPGSAASWRSVFSAFGIPLAIEPTGCCGMAGLFGHEREHKAMSKKLFDMSWRSQVAAADPDRILATGFSCRCQIKRFAGFRPRHPAEALLEYLSTEKTQRPQINSLS